MNLMVHHDAHPHDMIFLGSTDTVLIWNIKTYQLRIESISDNQTIGYASDVRNPYGKIKVKLINKETGDGQYTSTTFKLTRVSQ